MRDFYNTNKSAGEILTKARQDARNQQELIYAYYQIYKKGSPSQVHGRVFDNMAPLTPITSTRRAITNLTDAGYLVKTDRMVEGDYGKMEHVWQIAPKPGEQGSLF
jgi:hypothetical protein